MFTRKHYVAIAKALCTAHQTEPQCGQSIDFITANLSVMFKKDNPRFDRELFERAARCDLSKRKRSRSKSGLRLFGADEPFMPYSSTVITERGVYRR